MKRIIITCSCLVLTVTGFSTPAQAAPENINQFLEPIRQAHNLPALSAAVVKDGKTVAAGTVGFRKSGSQIPVIPDDKFHIGSNTKSMTATLAAILIEQGKLTWNTTIAETFPELKKSMHKDYHNVTIEQLLSHRGGMPGSLPKDNALWGRIWQNTQTMPPIRQRYFLVKEVTKNKPEATPGQKYIYSNAGVATAGAILERRTKRTWESLMKTHLFKPLKMTSAGFGPPASPGKTDQPWGHLLENNKPKPVSPGAPAADNPPAIGPAGTVHCSMTDYAKYAAFHLRSANGNEPQLPKASFQKLHTAIEGQNYALGWIVTQRDWAGGTVLTHSGSNTMFFTTIWLAPKKDFAVMVSCNIGGTNAAKACDSVAWNLIQNYLIKSK